MADRIKTGTTLIEEGTLLPNRCNAKASPGPLSTRRWNHSRIAKASGKTKQIWGSKWQRQSIRELSLSRMAYSYRTRCDSKASPVRLAEIGQESRWVRIGSKNQRSGMELFWLAGEIGATVFGFDGQKTVRRAVKRILGNLKSGKLIPWKSREWPRNVFWDYPTRVSPPIHDISRKMSFSCEPRTIRSGTEQN